MTRRPKRRTRADPIPVSSAAARSSVCAARRSSPGPGEHRGTRLASASAGNPKGRRGIFVCQVQISGVLLASEFLAASARRAFEVGPEADTLRAT